MAKAAYTARTRIKMNGKLYMPGDTIELDEAEAKRLASVVTQAGNARRSPAPKPAGNQGGGNDPLEGVAFASPQAALKAKEFELKAEHFENQQKSGETGYTVEDVERIADALTK